MGCFCHTRKTHSSPPPCPTHPTSPLARLPAHPPSTPCLTPHNRAFVPISTCSRAAVCETGEAEAELPADAHRGPADGRRHPARRRGLSVGRGGNRSHPRPGGVSGDAVERDAGVFPSGVEGCVRTRAVHAELPRGGAHHSPVCLPVYVCFVGNEWGCREVAFMLAPYMPKCLEVGAPISSVCLSALFNGKGGRRGGVVCARGLPSGRGSCVYCLLRQYFLAGWAPQVSNY